MRHSATICGRKESNSIATIFLCIGSLSAALRGTARHTRRGAKKFPLRRENAARKRTMTNLTNNKAVLSWIDEMTAITKPDKIVWITGEEDQISELREQAVREGILIKLNPDKVVVCRI